MHLPLSTLSLVSLVSVSSSSSLSSSLSSSSVSRLPPLALNNTYVTVSGLSSGGYFAVQMHVAYSELFQGCGVFAGGPFFCAGLPPASIATAQTACMTTPSLISVDSLVQITKNTALTGTIDPLSNLHDDRVWVFSGTNDTVVHTGVVEKLAHYYGEFITSPNRVQAEYSVSAQHSMPTLDYGNACAYLGEPYINNCGYDAVGEMLQHIYDHSLLPPSNTTATAAGSKSSAAGESSAAAGRFVEFPQTEFISLPWTTATAGLYKTGVVYVPPQCEPSDSRDRDSPCRLHVAYHGCKQTIPLIGTQYYMNTGYPRWADANDIVVLFPQAMANVNNPNSCWDWWGYTGVDYASHLGVQMTTSRAMIRRLLSTE